MWKGLKSTAVTVPYLLSMRSQLHHEDCNQMKRSIAQRKNLQHILDMYEFMSGCSTTPHYPRVRTHRTSKVASKKVAQRECPLHCYQPAGPSNLQFQAHPPTDGGVQSGHPHLAPVSLAWAPLALSCCSTVIGQCWELADKGWRFML